MRERAPENPKMSQHGDPDIIGTPIPKHLEAVDTRALEASYGF